MTTDPSRDAFEDFLRDKWHPSAHAQLLARTGSEYSNHIIQERWVGWQAAMAHKGADCWQSIETAPRDGTVVLLTHPKGRMGDGCHHPRYGVWSWPYVMLEPTHWQPLPAAPKQEGST